MSDLIYVAKRIISIDNGLFDSKLELYALSKLLYHHFVGNNNNKGRKHKFIFKVIFNYKSHRWSKCEGLTIHCSNSNKWNMSYVVKINRVQIIFFNRCCEIFCHCFILLEPYLDIVGSPLYLRGRMRSPKISREGV